MWHEARKQEKVVRKAIVDYRKRAERRHDYYEKIKQDPTKFMQIHGSRAKIHIDETGKIQSDNSTSMMPWQGDKTQMIDRYDVRALLDFIREVKSKPSLDITVDKEERKCNYERYRVIVFNKFKEITEDEHLKTIDVNELYCSEASTLQRQEAEAAKKQLSAMKAQIGYDYGGGGGGGDSSSLIIPPGGGDDATDDVTDDVEDEDDTSDIEAFINGIQDIPLSRDYYTSSSLEELGRCSLEYGMTHDDYSKQLKLDQELQESKEIAKAIETEKAKMAGKQSRRQRRILKDELLKNRTIGRLSYAKYESDEEKNTFESESSSSSEEEEDFEGKIGNKSNNQIGTVEFVTSFDPKNNSSNHRKSSNSSPKFNSTSNSRKSPTSSSSMRSHHRDVDTGKGKRRSPEEHQSSSRRYDHHRSDHYSSSRDDYRSGRHSRDYRRRSRSRHRSPDNRSAGGDSRRRSRSPYSSRRRSRSTSQRRSFVKSSTAAATKLKSSAATRGKTGNSAAAQAGDKKLTPQERLKIKMQRALKKQLKADKNAQAEKKAQEYQSQLERADELREMAKKMKRRNIDRKRSPPDRDWRY